MSRIQSESEASQLQRSIINLIDLYWPPASHTHTHLLHRGCFLIGLSLSWLLRTQIPAQDPDLIAPLQFLVSVCLRHLWLAANAATDCSHRVDEESANKSFSFVLSVADKNKWWFHIRHLIVRGSLKSLHVVYEEEKEVSGELRLLLIGLITPQTHSRGTHRLNHCFKKTMPYFNWIFLSRKILCANTGHFNLPSVYVSIFFNIKKKERKQHSKFGMRLGLGGRFDLWTWRSSCAQDSIFQIQI